MIHRKQAMKYIKFPNVEIKGYNVMVDGKSFFDQPIKIHKITCENIRKIATGQGDDYTTMLTLKVIIRRLQ